MVVVIKKCYKFKNKNIYLVKKLVVIYLRLENNM